MRKTFQFARVAVASIVIAASFPVVAPRTSLTAQSPISGDSRGGPRIPTSHVAPAVTFRGERLEAATVVRRRDTIVQISLLGIVLGVVLLVLLL